MQAAFDTKKSVQLVWRNNFNTVVYFTVSLLPLSFAYFFLFDDNPDIPPVLGLIPLAISLIFIITGLASHLNVTEFNLKRGRMVSSTKPIPIGGKIDFPIREIKCFKATFYRNSSSGGSYSLSVELKNGRIKRIPKFPLSKIKAKQVSAILNAKYLKNDETV